MTDLSHTFDRFSLPAEIPDRGDAYPAAAGPAPLPPAGGPPRCQGTAAGGGREPGAAQSDWRARGLAHPAGRGWAPEDPRGSPVFLGELAAGPAPHIGEELAPAHPAQVFTPPLQVRFLDALANSGNARASAARVGVSHETVYRQRRRCPRFAALWQGALVHARARVAQEIGDRALDGWLEDVRYRGELVGQRRRFDSRLLLAHMARLDRLASAADGEGREAARTARWFEAELARLAGHPEPAGFDEAQGLWERKPGDPSAATAPPPPTRREFVAWFAGQAAGTVDDERVWARARKKAGALYDAWEAGVTETVDAIVAGADAAAAPQRAGDPPAATGARRAPGDGADPAVPAAPATLGADAPVAAPAPDAAPAAPIAAPAAAAPAAVTAAAASGRARRAALLAGTAACAWAPPGSAAAARLDPVTPVNTPAPTGPAAAAAAGAGGEGGDGGQT